jgi:hypothetical protein
MIPFRKRAPRTHLVRLHLHSDQPSFEGILLGLESGHYRLANAVMIVTAEQTINQSGSSRDGQQFTEIWVRADRVLHLQVVG